MLKKLEILLSILLLAGFLGSGIPSFVQGVMDGYNGIERDFTVSTFFQSIWHLSAISYFILRLVRYRNKQ